jgi:hypothetical protein
VIRRVESN